MKKTVWIWMGLTAVLGAAGAEDLGQKIGSYAVKDGKKVWQEDRFGNRTNYEYDKAGELVEVKRSGALITGNVYENGLLKEQKTISGATVRMNYDDQGRMIEKQTPGGKSELSYDKYGRMVGRKGAGEYPLQFAYSGWGELTAYTDGNNATTKFEYNPNGKLAKRVWPDGTVVKYGYANGKLVSKEEAGRKTTYAYDDYGRMIEEKIVLGKESLTTRMTYDKDGRLASITEGKNTVRFAYDRFGRKLMEDSPVGTLTMMYDGKGRLTARQVQFKNSKEKFLTEYAYDEHDRVISVKSPSGTFNYTWTKDNKIATQSVGDKKVVNTYDKAGRLTSKMFGDTVLAKYEYDELDRRVKGQYFDVKWDYSYDQYNQLIGANNSKGDSYAYTYDPIGNRLKAVENGKERNFTYNSLNQISNDGYAYDAWGNMTRTPEAEYKYDLKNRLVEVKKKDGTVVGYSYDPLAQRIVSVVNGNKITEFLMSEMVEYARNDGKEQYHTLGLDLLGSLDKTGAVGGILATNDHFYLYDGNGNVTTSVKAGTIVNKLVYTPFGMQTAGAHLSFAFSSKLVDQSEVCYYGYRFYVNAIGRWVSRDPILEQGGINVLSMLDNDTINNIDILGRESLSGTFASFTCSASASYTCSNCCNSTTYENGYCLKVSAGTTSGNITFNEVNGATTIETDENTGKTRTCYNIYRLESGELYEKVLQHESLHKAKCGQANAFMQGQAQSYSGFYASQSGCTQAGDAAKSTLTSWWNSFNQNQSNHVGSEWDGIRPSNYPQPDSSRFTLKEYKCSEWK